MFSRMNSEPISTPISQIIITMHAPSAPTSTLLLVASPIHNTISGTVRILYSSIAVRDWNTAIVLVIAFVLLYRGQSELSYAQSLGVRRTSEQCVLVCM